MANVKICSKCGGPRWGIKTDMCRSCKIEESPELQKSKIKRLYVNRCDDIQNYEKDIKILMVKERCGFLTPVDIFKVAHIYMSVICNDQAFSPYNPIKQVELMLGELYLCMTSPHFERSKPGRKPKKKVNI